MEHTSEFRELSAKEREALRKELKKFTALAMDGGNNFGLDEEKEGEEME